MGPAKRDMASIEAYTLKTWGARQAAQYTAEITSKFRSLRDAPAMGAGCDDIEQGLRFFAVGKHVIYYRVAGSELVVMRVLHKQMDAGRHLQ